MSHQHDWWKVDLWVMNCYQWEESNRGSAQSEPSKQLYLNLKTAVQTFVFTIWPVNCCELPYLDLKRFSQCSGNNYKPIKSQLKSFYTYIWLTCHLNGMASLYTKEYLGVNYRLLGNCSPQERRGNSQEDWMTNVKVVSGMGCEWLVNVCWMFVHLFVFDCITFVYYFCNWQCFVSNTSIDSV